MLNSQEINLLFLKWEFQPLIIMLKVRNTKRILKILKGWTYDQCLRKSLSSQLLPNKRLLSIKKPQPSMVLLVQLSKDPFMCSLKKKNSFNAEILCCLFMVLVHDSYNSCCDLSKLFERIFPDSDIAKAFTLG